MEIASLLSQLVIVGLLIKLIYNDLHEIRDILIRHLEDHGKH